MAPHHTKDKGDLGVAKAHADLAGKGYVVLFPATEHAPFDLVAYADGRFHRIQVKYRAARQGVVDVRFRSTWSERNGTHTEPVDKTSIDLLCVYCPDSDACYYLRPAGFGKSVTLRVTPTGNGQHIGVREATSFRGIPTATFGDAVGTHGGKPLSVVADRA